MGTSNWQNISYCIEIIRRINPRTILDVGAGFGRWGFLSREFLEIWDDCNYSDNWKRKIDAVEIFDKYVKPYHSYFYDNVYIENAIDFINKQESNYDLIICGDIIEHLEKKEGKEFIDGCLKHSRYLMINIPIGKKWEQDIINENEYEIHKSQWYYSDFKKYPNRKIKKFRDYILRKFGVILLSIEKIDLKSEYKKKYGKYFFVKNILNNKLNLGMLVNKLSKKKPNV
ncbi:MAG: class I SAM-dependent methyltransferase [Ignavibacteria bacterium]|jgi:predicted SAM-dependent methyltransferase